MQVVAASHRRPSGFCFSAPANRSPVFGFTAHHMTSDSHTFLIISAQFTAVAQRNDYWSRPVLGEMDSRRSVGNAAPPPARRDKGVDGISPHGLSGPGEITSDVIGSSIFCNRTERLSLGLGLTRALGSPPRQKTNNTDINIYTISHLPPLAQRKRGLAACRLEHRHTVAAWSCQTGQP